MVLSVGGGVVYRMDSTASIGGMYEWFFGD